MIKLFLTMLFIPLISEARDYCGKNYRGYSIYCGNRTHETSEEKYRKLSEKEIGQMCKKHIDGLIKESMIGKKRDDMAMNYYGCGCNQMVSGQTVVQCISSLNTGTRNKK